MNNFFTLLIIPEKKGKSFQVQLQRKWLHIASIAALFVFLISIAIGVHYLYILGQEFEAETVQKESLSLQKQLKIANDQIAQMEKRLLTLNQLDEKLRTLTAIATPQGNLPQETQKPFVLELPNGIDFTSLQESILASRLEGLAEETERQIKSLSSLIDYFSFQKTLLSRTPSIWPSQGWISSHFGYRTDPYTGNQALHTGIDIAAPEGTKIIAPAAGHVLFVGKNGAFGNFIRLDHGYGLVTQYGHLLRTNVQIGDYVKRGDTIAFLGNSGRSTGPHLHYEVWQNGLAVNPRKFILE